MIEFDCHTHTAFSSDSETAMEDQVKEAIRRGLTGICFTDHMDLEFPIAPESPGNFEFEPEAYIRELNRLQPIYADRIRILKGIEIGLRNEDEAMKKRLKDRYLELTAKYDFDFVLGSTHCLENTDPALHYYWEGRTCRDGIEEYFKAILENVRFYDEFDSCGHLDYLIRYVPKSDKAGDVWNGPDDYRPADYMDLIDLILRELISKGKALECNSAGLKYRIGFAHPKEEILKRYLELGGELLTIGSDGHRPEHLCYDFSTVREMLIDQGFKYYTVFEGRKPVMYSL